MAKETYLGANVEITTDSFAGWINKTNQVRDDMGRIVVTVTKLANTEPSVNNAGLTVGNAAIEGVLTVNTMAVSADLRGGDVLNSGNLIVSSNVHFTQSANVWISANTNRFDIDANNTFVSSNVTFDGGSTKRISVNVANTTITNGSFYVRSNTEFTGATANVETTALNVTANSTFSGANTTIGGDGVDVLNVNAVSDFNANVNIDGITTHTANVHITDGDYLLIGAGDDLQIYHDGTNSYIKDSGTGNLNIDGSVVNIRGGADGAEVMAVFNDDGAVELYHDNVKKIETTSTGVDVFGEVALKAAATNQIVGESTTTAYQQLDFKLRTSAQNERTPLILTTSNTVIAGANSAYDLGSTATNWRHVYAKNTTTANSAVISNTLTVNTQANTASMMVRDLTATRIVYAGTGGELVDSANLAFSGTSLSVIGNVSATANVGAAIVNAGTLNVTGNTDATIINGTSLNLTGDAEIDGSLTVRTNLDVFGDVTLSSNTQLSANISLVDNLTARQKFYLGTAGGSYGDATIVGDIVPNIDSSYDIGTNTIRYASIYADNFVGSLNWSNVTNKPDPVVTVTLTGDVTGSASTTLTDLGNGNISIATAVQPNSVALGTDTTGNYAGSITGDTGISVTGVAGEGTAYTVAHADTSSVANVAINNSSGTVLQDMTLEFDGFGHATAAQMVSVNLDTRYSQNTFNTVAVSGQSNIVADSLTDTLTFASEGIVSITTNAVNDTVTISANEVDTLHSVTSRGNTTTNNITVNDIGARNLVLSGNLTVSGTVTSVNTEEVNIDDNIILLNSNYTGSTPSENGGIEIKRGTLPNKQLIWDETNDRWTVGDENFVANTFIGNLTGAVTGNASTASALQTARTITLGGDLSGSASFDGSSNATITATVANDSHTHDGRYYTEAESDARFLRSDAGDEKTAGYTRFNDNIELYFGNDNDVSHIWDGSNYAIDVLTGNMYVDINGGGDIIFRDGNSSDTQRFVFDIDTGDLTATTFTGALVGNASTATTLQTARTIALTGDVTGSTTFNGGGNATITATVADDSHTHDGRYYTEAESDARFYALASPNIFTGTYTRFNDSSELRFGTGNDVTMYYGGTHFFTNIASGAWYLNFVTGQNLNIQNDGTTTLQLKPADGEVRADKFSFYSQSTSRFDYEANTAGISGAQASNVLLKLGVSTDFIITKHDTNGDYMWYSRSNGNVQISGNFISASDERLKENIVPIEGALEKVANLNGVYYNRIGKDKREVGLIAQNVETQIPELVYSDGDGMKAVDYPSTVAVLIEAIKELKAEIDVLKGEKQ